MTHQTFVFKSNNNALFGQYWQTEKAKANIVLVHGMGEHSSRYSDFFVPKFLSEKYNVIALDHYGHGKTEGKRGDCPSYEAVLDSVDALITKADEFLDADLPKIIYGHSMGGNVVANFILKRNQKLQAAVLSSPMLRLAFEVPKWKLIGGKVMRHIYPSYQESTGLAAAAISRDKEEVEKYKNDPLVHDKITTNFSLPFFEAGEWAIAHANKLRIPTLMIHGTGDQLTDYKASQEFAQNASEIAEIKIYEGGYHELHNDIIKGEVMNDVISWLDKKVY